MQQNQEQNHVTLPGDPQKSLDHTTEKNTPNESVEKAFLESENKILGGHLTLPKHEIVDCGAFCEVFFFHISHENLLGDFPYRLNDWAGEPLEGSGFEKEIPEPGFEWQE
jgi:hypothetical protein